MKGKTALITGAARGLGLLVAQELAQGGMNIAGVDVKGDELCAAMRDVAAKFKVKALPLVADIGSEAQVVALVKNAVQEFGQIDVLVNNAGVRQIAPVWETTVGMWDVIHNSNLKGHFLCTREVLRQGMLDRKQGVIIFVSSGSGKKGEESSSSYCASKWGILGFAESVMKDLKGTKIRVTSITPGMIETPMARESEAWELGLDWLDPAHVSRAIVYCINQDPDTIIPEFRIYHRAQV